jgi:hypothetical protein
MVGFAEPVRKRDFCPESLTSQGAKGCFEVGVSDEDVAILGVSLDARVAGEGICAANEKVNASLFEDAQGVAIELFGFGFQNCGAHLHK